MAELPGSRAHQRVLRVVASRYADDPRVRAVIVFGSLGRGDWDEQSDVDLDVILADGVAFDLQTELARLGHDFGDADDPPVVTLPAGDDAGDFVLASLTGISIRFHPLGATSPNILDSMVLLAGHVSVEEIRRAGRANGRPGRELSDLLGTSVRFALETDRFLCRGRLWLAIESLHRLRDALMALYSATHGGTRPTHAFEAYAPAGLQWSVGQTLPGFDPPAIRAALNRAIALLADDLDDLTAGEVALTGAQRDVLAVIAAR